MISKCQNSLNYNIYKIIKWQKVFISPKTEEAAWLSGERELCACSMEAHPVP